MKEADQSNLLVITVLTTFPNVRHMRSTLALKRRVLNQKVTKKALNIPSGGGGAI